MRKPLIGLAAIGLCLLASGSRPIAAGPIVIDGQNGIVLSGLHISSTDGDCVRIINSTNITIRNSDIGPCGTDQTTQNSRGILIRGSSNINVYDSYVHVETLASVCGDSHSGIEIINGTGPVTIQGNVVAYNERNIVAYNASNVSVIGNFLLNPRGAASCPNPDNLGGPNFQAWADSTSNPNMNITVSNNYALSSSSSQYLYPGNVSDSINFGVTNGVVAQANYVVGGQYVHGCGINADYGANSVQFLNNIVSDTGNCGIGISGGTKQRVDGNKILILNPHPASGGNVGLSIVNWYLPLPCGPVAVTNNLSYEQQPNGWLSGYWYGGGCGSMNVTNNTWNQAAYNLLYPMAVTNPPPLIPPLPQECVAVSPYSTQTSLPSCGSKSNIDTTPPSTPTGLTVSAVSSNQINLAWNPSTDNVGVTGYKVNRNGTQVGTSSTTSYSNTGLTEGTTYSYTVSAYDGAGNISAQSSEVSITTPTQGPVRFARGARVKTTAYVNVRLRPSNGGQILGTQPAGSRGIIVAGPEKTSGNTWWKIDFDSGADGWSVQSYLTIITN